MYPAVACHHVGPVGGPVRLAVEQKADRDDILEPLERLTQQLERLHPLEPEPDSEPDPDPR